MNFLGHTVGNGKMMIPEMRAEAILGYTKPTTKRGVRSCLGAVSFYRRYVKLLASDTATLSPATSKAAAPAKILWTPEVESAFTSICKSVAQSCILTIPLPEDTMSIVTEQN